MIPRNRTPLVLLPVVLALLGAGLPPARAEERPPEATPSFWLAKAERIAKRIEHPEGRAALLVSIGTGWVEADELERARPLLEAAVRYGRQCRGCISKARRLAEIALLQHRAGDEMGSGATFEIAREACDELDGARHVQALAYLAQQRQAAGEAMVARMLFADATKAATALEGVERGEAFAAVADAEAAAGNLVPARQARQRLWGGTNHSGSDGRAIRDATLLAGALAEIEARDLPMAREILDAVADRRLRVSGLCALARAAGAEGGGPKVLERALDLARMLARGHERADAGLEVARTAADLGAEALGTQARALGEEAALGRPDIGLAVRWADLSRRAGDVRLARTILKEFGRLVPLTSDDPTRRAELRGLLAAAMVRAGDPLGAERLLVGLEDPVGRVRARLALAGAYRVAGNTERALVVCGHQLRRMATWPDGLAADRAESMRQAARLQAACGKPAEAAATVDAIAAPFHAATACTYIARDLT